VQNREKFCFGRLKINSDIFGAGRNKRDLNWKQVHKALLLKITRHKDLQSGVDIFIFIGTPKVHLPLCKGKLKSIWLSAITQLSFNLPLFFRDAGTTYLVETGSYYSNGQ
jgi:hypothetical protein